MTLYTLFHNGDDVIFSKESVSVDCEDLSTMTVIHNGYTYKIGKPVMDGLKRVSIVINEDGISDTDVISSLKEFAVETLRLRILNTKAAYAEWEKYNE